MCGQVHSPKRMCSSPPTLRLGTHADGLTTDTCAPRTWTRPPSPPVHTALPTWCSSRRQRGLGLSVGPSSQTQGQTTQKGQPLKPQVPLP